MSTDNYLYLSNDNTEIEIGDFHDSDMKIYGRYKKPFLERLVANVDSASSIK